MLPNCVTEIFTLKGVQYVLFFGNKDFPLTNNSVSLTVCRKTSSSERLSVVWEAGDEADF